MIKKITALILSLSLSLCSTAAFSFADNKDIKEDTLYENMMKQKKKHNYRIGRFKHQRINKT